MINKKKRILVFALIAGVILGGFLAARWWPPADDDGLFASGTVEATEARLGFQAAGRIALIAAREGDAVKEGKVLARLDTRETEARLAQANAQVQATRARLADARREHKRNTALLAGNAIGRETFDKSRLAVDIADSDHAQGQANVQALEALLANMTIRASFDGIVTVRHREPGEIVSAGQPVITVMNPGDRWVRIYIPENRVGAVHLGQVAAVATDTYPDKRYTGEVVYIAPEAEFTPKNVQTAEERVKLVYSAKVRITEDERLELKPGMPADVRLEVVEP